VNLGSDMTRIMGGTRTVTVTVFCWIWDDPVRCIRWHFCTIFHSQGNTALVIWHHHFLTMKYGTDSRCTFAQIQCINLCLVSNLCH